MKDKEIKDLVKKLEKYRKELSRSEEKSRKFLVQTGIITEKGNLRKPYRNIRMTSRTGLTLGFHGTDR